jgi:hypothetical protein
MQDQSFMRKSRYFLARFKVDQFKSQSLTHRHAVSAHASVIICDLAKQIDGLGQGTPTRRIIRRAWSVEWSQDLIQFYTACAWHGRQIKFFRGEIVGDKGLFTFSGHPVQDVVYWVAIFCEYFTSFILRVLVDVDP